MTFLERLEDLRKQRGWTWSEWERQAKLNPRHISAILNRARARDDFRPDWQTLRALAKAAGVTPEWLAEGEEGEVPGPSLPAAVRVERDPAPHLDTSHLSTPLERAVGHAFDPKRHDWADGQDVIQALQRDLHGHDRPEVDLIEAARRWLDAAHALRREGTPVTAGTLLDRITLGKNSLLRGGSDSASEAMQREMVEHAAREGVTFGEGAAAIEEFRQRGKPAARDVGEAEQELGKRAGEGIDETSGNKGRRG